MRWRWSLVVLALVAGCTGGPADSPSDRASSTSSVHPRAPEEMPAYRLPDPAVALASGEWSTLPDSPIAPRVRSAMVWTGSEVIVWGGVSTERRSDRVFYDDGAAFDPAANSWRVLPPSPLEAGPATGVWVDGRVVINGATYDPVTDTWEVLPPGPFATGVQFLEQTAVAGNLLYVWRTTQLDDDGSSGTTSEGAVLDPSTATWTALPPAPLEDAWHSRGIIAWTGSALLLLSEWDKDADAGIDAARFDPEQAMWTTLASPAVSGESSLPGLKLLFGGEFVYWTGTSLVGVAGPRELPSALSASGYGASEQLWANTGGQYEPSSGVHTPLPSPPMAIAAGPSVWRDGMALVWTAQSPLVADGVGPGRFLVFDSGANEWWVGPSVESGGTCNASAVWADDEVILWGGEDCDSRIDAVPTEIVGHRYRPAEAEDQIPDLHLNEIQREDGSTTLVYTALDVAEGSGLVLSPTVRVTTREGEEPTEGIAAPDVLGNGARARRVEDPTSGAAHDRLSWSPEAGIVVEVDAVGLPADDVHDVAERLVRSSAEQVDLLMAAHPRSAGVEDFELSTAGGATSGNDRAHLDPVGTISDGVNELTLWRGIVDLAQPLDQRSFGMAVGRPCFGVGAEPATAARACSAGWAFDRPLALQPQRGGRVLLLVAAEEAWESSSKGPDGEWVTTHFGQDGSAELRAPGGEVQELQPVAGADVLAGWLEPGVRAELVVTDTLGQQRNWWVQAAT